MEMYYIQDLQIINYYHEPDFCITPFYILDDNLQDKKIVINYS